LYVSYKKKKYVAHLPSVGGIPDWSVSV
jgi:hypothetical protein